jgi:hypothetical protein
VLQFTVQNTSLPLRAALPDFARPIWSCERSARLFLLLTACLTANALISTSFRAELAGLQDIGTM